MAKYADAVASAIFVLFALGCLTMSLALPLGTPLEPLPGFVPLIISVFLLAVSVIQLGYSLLGKNKEIVKVGEDWRHPLAVIGGLVVYSLTLNWLGYIIATSGLCLLILRLFDKDGWVKPIAISITVAILTYVLFDRVLDVNLPEGVLAAALPATLSK